MSRHWKFGLMGALLGCSGGASLQNECRPGDMKCESNAQYHCAPDLELIQHGQHVYVWQELLFCDDDPVLGKGVCIETKLASGLSVTDCDFAASSSKTASTPSL